jgi:hypothetical protein
MIRFALVAGVLALSVGCSRAPPQAAQEPPQEVVAEEAVATPEALRQNLGAKLFAGQPIVIENPYGSVFLRFGGYEHEIGIHTTLQQPDGAPEISFKSGHDNGRYLIAPLLPKGAALAEAQRLDLVVYVPEQHDVSVRTMYGDIESRGVRSNLDLKSTDGNIAVRGTEGLVNAETGAGSIEVAMAGTAPKNSRQRLATITGRIVLGVTDRLDATIRLMTSAMFGTDYSIEVTRLPGEEPNKKGKSTIGMPQAEILLESRRGEIRLERRAEYLPVENLPPTPPPK